MQGEGLGAGWHASVRTVCVALALSAMAAFGLMACGDDSDSEQSGMTTATRTPPPNAGPPSVEEAIAEQFTVPQPTENAPPGSAAAIQAGREVCKGKTPQQIRDEFLPAVEGELTEGQLEMIEDIERYEKQVTPSFVAGQLAAGVYEATLTENEERGGYQGCVYELAQKLQRELKKKQP